MIQPHAPGPDVFSAIADANRRKLLDLLMDSISALMRWTTSFSPPEGDGIATISRRNETSSSRRPCAPVRKSVFLSYQPRMLRHTRAAVSWQRRGSIGAESPFL